MMMHFRFLNLCCFFFFFYPRADKHSLLTLKHCHSKESCETKAYWLEHGFALETALPPDSNTTTSEVSTEIPHTATKWTRSTRFTYLCNSEVISSHTARIKALQPCMIKQKHVEKLALAIAVLTHKMLTSLTRLTGSSRPPRASRTP